MDLNDQFDGLSGLKSRKKAGFLCPYTVEELIDAAGLVPVRLVPHNPDLDTADEIERIYSARTHGRRVDL